ncbi:MAG: DUF2207 domain-containing protein, partial [Gemmatimonadota bacterium]
WPRRTRRAAAIAAALVAGAALLGTPPRSSAAPASLPLPDAARSWVIESFRAEVLVLENGDIVVTETIQPRFEGQYNGIYRDIPVEYRSPSGTWAKKIRLDVQSVTDGRGDELRHEISRERHYKRIKVWVPGAVDATRTVVIKYRVARALLHFEAGEGAEDIGQPYDELYWNVTGDEWPVPIEAASAVIRLPVEATGIRAHAFTGPYGSVEQAAEVTIDGSVVSVRAQRRLDYREGLTVGVAWNAGVVETPGRLDRAWWFVTANWPLVLPVFAFLAMFHRWRTRGKDPELGSIEPRYEPPERLTPAEVGVIIDNSPDMRDVTATVVDLAVRGYLDIEETEERKLLGLMSDRDYVFHLKRPEEEWEGLEPHERRLLDAFFTGSSERVELSELKNKFYKHLPDLKDGLMDTLVEHDVYARRPDHVAGVYLVVALIVGVGLTVVGMAGAERLGLSRAAVAIGGVGSGLLIAGFGLVMPARTREGTRILRMVKGFEEFLERVESDRFKRMITGPEMFEKYLPFAMALGVESQWAAAFADMYREPPQWYHGADWRAFNASLFVSDLGRMTGQAATVMQSAPRSSGGSSFGGGGGFSGGGGGGGGGGAF